VPAPLPPVELRHLQALRAVAATGSFGRAAEALGFTQSAVSQQIGALERALGQSMFDRPGGSRPVQLTEAGELLLERSEEILDRLSVTLADLDQLRRGERGRIRIGTFQSASEHLVPRILGRLRAERPHVEADLHESEDVEDLQRRLLSGRLEISFLVGGVADFHEDLEVIELFSEPYMVLAGVDEPEGPMPVSMLEDRALIGQHDHICQRLITAGLRALGSEPTYAFHTSDNGAVHAMVRNGMGVSIMPRLAIDASDPGLTVHALDPPLPDRHVLLGWRADSPSVLVRTVADLATEVVGELDLRP